MQNFLVILFITITVCYTEETTGQPQCSFLTDPMNDKHKEDLNRLSQLNDQRFTVEDGLEDGFIYNIGICTSSEIAAGAVKTSSGTALSQTGVTQMKKSGNGEIISIGRMDKAEIKAGSSWILLEYAGGDSYHHSCNGVNRTANIMIICKEGETKGKARLIEENKENENNCYYLFEIDHQAACQQSSDSSGLGAGSIFIIVLFCAIVVYVVGGMLYQRLVNGAKGMEQFPNIEFWRDFGNLQADGCNFICRSGSSSHREPRSYRGIGDDQLQAEEEEDLRDEHLLPM